MVAVQGLTVTRPFRWARPVVAIGIVATVVGLLLSLWTMTTALSLAPVHGPSSFRVSDFRISDDVPTSFGIVAVEFVRSVDQTSHRALPRVTHGVSDLVGSSRQQIQVAVALTNQKRQPLKYTVRQFELHVTTAGKTSVLAATSGDLPDGRILPDAGIEGHLDFTLPAAKSAISLHFRDPGTSAPIVIDLGAVAEKAAPVPARYRIR